MYFFWSFCSKRQQREARATRVNLVEEDDKVADHVEAVADNNEGQLVGQLGLLEEVLDALGIKVLVLAADALDLAQLVGLDGRLDVLEDDFLVGAEVDDGAEEVEQALVGLEALEEVNQRLWRQLLVVLGGDLRRNGQ